jgi:hypothetical protein
MKNILYKRAESRHDLQGILDLQKKNNRDTIPDSEKTLDGFTTVEHDIGILEKMNDKPLISLLKMISLESLHSSIIR